MKPLVAAVEAFARVVLRERPDLTPEYFHVVRAGWLQGGVGGAVSPKIMVRVQGPSDDPADDDLLESKKDRRSPRHRLPQDAHGSTNAPHHRRKQTARSAEVRHTGGWTRARRP